MVTLIFTPLYMALAVLLDKWIDATKELNHTFGEFFSSPISPTKLLAGATEQHVEEFFNGIDTDRNCLYNVALDLDAKRTSLLNSATCAVSESGPGVHCVEFVGERQQGKTTLMARLAYNLAVEGKRVFWASGENVPECLDVFEANR